jgi:predicted dehydrogenase
MAKAKPLRVGLLGLGRMGQNHLRVLSAIEPIQVDFIYDTDCEKAARLAGEYGVRSSDDPEKDLKTVDAAIIVTPTATHASYITLAARFTPLLFVEKPLTDSMESASAVAEIAREKGLRIQVGFIERFNPAFRRLRQVVGCDRPILHMDFRRTDKVPDRNLDIDVVLDLMVHDLDLALFLGGPVTSVQGHGISRNGITALAHAVLIHENGTQSRILASKLTPKRIRSIGLTTEDFYAEADLLQRQFSLNPPEALASCAPEQPVNHNHGPLFDQLLAFADYCRDDACEGVSMIPTMDAAMATMELAERIRSSIAAGSSADQHA